MVQSLFGHRQANQPTTVLRHEVDGLRRDLFRRQGQIALVLPVFIVNDYDHPASTNFFNCGWDVGEGGRGIHDENCSSLRRLSRWIDQADDPKDGCGNCRSCWDGQDPCPDNAPGHAPADRRKAVHGAYTDNRSCDGVGGANRNPGQGSAEQV